MVRETSELDGLMQSRRIDATADYLARGREYSEVSDGELLGVWTTTWSRMTKAPYAKLRAMFATISDLESEFALRGKPVPDDLVKSDAVRVGKRVVRTFFKRIEADPELFREVGEELMHELNEFNAARARSQN